MPFVPYKERFLIFPNSLDPTVPELLMSVELQHSLINPDLYNYLLEVLPAAMFDPVGNIYAVNPSDYKTVYDAVYEFYGGQL